MFWGYKQRDLWFPALFMQTYSIMSAAVQAQTQTVLLLLPLEHLNRITKQFRLTVTLDWTEKPENTQLRGQWPSCYEDLLL